MLDEALHAAGNGCCDGGDIGSGTINIYLEEVVQPERACATVVEALRNAGELEGAIVALDNDPEGEGEVEPAYRVLWPPGFTGEFSLGDFPSVSPGDSPVNRATAPCPYCGQPLRTALARQCRPCRRDWHNPEQIRWLGEGAK